MKRVRVGGAPGRISKNHESKSSLWQAGAALLLSLAAISLTAAVAPQRTPTTLRHRRLSISPSSINFGNVTIGQSSSQRVTLTNSSSGTITVSQASVNGAGLSLSGLSLPLSLSPNQSSAFNMEFAPQAAGNASGSLSVWSNAPGSPTIVALSGTGVAATFLLTANPTSLNFGNVDVGSKSTQSVSLSTTGNSNVTISQVSVSGVGFSVSGVSSQQTLTPGQTATLGVTFTPTASGSANASCSIASNATGSPLTISLSGTGVTPTSHSATLSWTASISTNVVGYNIYRGTTSGGPYPTRVASLVTGTSFTDTSVQSGTTYYYVVTPMDSNGNESVYSNQATATIPSP